MRDATRLRPYAPLEAGVEYARDEALVYLANAYDALSQWLEETGRQAEAIEALSQAIATYPPDALRSRVGLYVRLGLLYRERGQFDQARWSFEQALLIDPNNGKAKAKLDELP